VIERKPDCRRNYLRSMQGKQVAYLDRPLKDFGTGMQP
jgi:hypothetical protein